jgi:uncharacterized protein (DUF1800 family)
MTQSANFDAALALSRLGLGSGPQGVSSVGDARAVLRSEIAQGALTPEAPGLKDTPALLADVYAYQQERKALRSVKPVAKTATQTRARPQMTEPMANMDQVSNLSQMSTTTTMDNLSAKPERNKPEFNPIRDTIQAEINARFNSTMKTPVIGFNERMVMFWMNHFAVSLKKSEAVGIMTGAYEREAIRPNTFGNFYDLLLAVETHPCMLEYLDNQQSIGPNAQVNRPNKLRRQRGLNENLAREIMELHTLGVGSGDTQADVTAFARVITGWTFNRNPEKGPKKSEVGAFTYNARAHEPGAQKILGKTYGDTGFDQGKAVLRDLARHPATANHIATKLARHFVADTPPPALVARLARTFSQTDGDLAAVSQTLIDSDECWTPQLTKIRSPLEYMCALTRSLNLTLKPNIITRSLTAMGQTYWEPSGPNGYPDTVAAWASPEGLSARLDVVNMLVTRADPSLDPRIFAESRLGDMLSESTRDAIARAETHAQGLSLALLSPEFMRR